MKEEGEKRKKGGYGDAEPSIANGENERMREGAVPMKGPVSV
jgi:hypothetical protein